MLSAEQKQGFWNTGCITVGAAVTAAQLAALRGDLSLWVEESRQHREPYGAMLDGRPRFDLEPGHDEAHPALRRVASPSELSSAYLEVLETSAMTDMVAELIGPDVRLHHCKINCKLPGSATAVKWHQDFTFDPHSNDDLITALLFLDDVTVESGPLLVAPGSHRGPLLSLWHGGRFTGAVDAATAAGFEAAAVRQVGPAGSVCLMHARLAHASAANRSGRPRTLFIAAMAAADAIPLAANAVPSIHAGRILRGREPGRIRSIGFETEGPEVPSGASFFDQQAGR